MSDRARFAEEPRIDRAVTAAVSEMDFSDLDRLAGHPGFVRAKIETDCGGVVLETGSRDADDGKRVYQVDRFCLDVRKSHKRGDAGLAQLFDALQQVLPHEEVHLHGDWFLSVAEGEGGGEYVLRFHRKAPCPEGTAPPAESSENPSLHAGDSTAGGVA